ncbi:MAG: SMC-Scp complex subunit ScpB [Micropruina sp.]|nr:SMC-Scp complex subunit ScpB [Micropruina sp.]
MSELSGALEALLLMASEPLSSMDLAGAAKAPLDQVELALAELQTFYDQTERGFELRFIAGGWRYYSRPEHAELISAWVLEGQHARLSQAALETLAVIAYLQPISRGRVAAVRGVSVDGVLRTLVTRELIQEVSRDSDSGAMLFGTTPYFLERMGLAGLDDLPPIAPYLPDATQLDDELSAFAARPAEAVGSSESPDTRSSLTTTDRPETSASQQKDTP